MRTAFLVIAVAVCATFYPSLYHVARADHWCFLAECAPYDSWHSMVWNLHSYTRVRTFEQGDTMLFRPLLFAFMCMEAWVFGWNFFWWQAVGIALHLAAVYALLRLLWAMHRGLFAMLATLFFATLYVGQMAVTWHHINGYVLFVVFQLWALYHVFRHVEEGQVHGWRLWTIAGLVLAGGLTYEAANVEGPVFAAYLWCASGTGASRQKSLPRRWLALLLVPAILYAAWNAVDYRYLHPAPSEVLAIDASRFAGKINLARTMGCTLAIPAAYAFAALFPSLQMTGYGTTLLQRPVNWDVAGTLSLHASPLALLVAAATAACLVAVGSIVVRRYRVGARQKTRPMAGPRWGFAAVALALMLAETLIVSIGRAQTRGLVDYVLKDSSYYAYLVVALMVVAAYAGARSLGFDALGRAAGPRVRLACACLLACVAVIGACRTFATNSLVSRQYPVWGSLMAAKVDATNLKDYYACATDGDYGGVLQMTCYRHLKYGVHCDIGLKQHARGSAKIGFACAVMPFQTNILYAMQLTERGDPERAVTVLHDSQNDNKLACWEYSQACFRSLDKCNAAIRREPDNPVHYSERAAVYVWMNDIANATNDVARVLRTGGTVHPSLLKALNMDTNAPAGTLHCVPL